MDTNTGILRAGGELLGRDHAPLRPLRPPLPPGVPQTVATVERAWQMKDSQAQILVLASR